MEEPGRRCFEEYLQISNVKGVHPANGGAKGIAGKAVRSPAAKREVRQKENPDHLQVEKEEILGIENPAGFDIPALWLNAPLAVQNG